jgi:hypothetical protein
MKERITAGGGGGGGPEGKEKRRRVLGHMLGGRVERENFEMYVAAE